MTTAATFGGDKADAEDLRECFLHHLGDALTHLQIVLADLVLVQSRHDDDLVSVVDDISHYLQAAARSARAGYALVLAGIEGQLPATAYPQPDTHAGGPQTVFSLGHIRNQGREARPSRGHSAIAQRSWDAPNVEQPGAIR